MLGSRVNSSPSKQQRTIRRPSNLSSIATKWCSKYTLLLFSAVILLAHFITKKVYEGHHHVIPASIVHSAKLQLSAITGQDQVKPEGEGLADASLPVVPKATAPSLDDDDPLQYEPEATINIEPGEVVKEGDGFGKWFEGCEYIYLDVGSNVGIQMRKLYEPRLYEGNRARHIFNRVFGADRQSIMNSSLCTIGFEPNPHRTPRLKELQAAYQKQGWRIHIFTETAATVRDGKTDFYLDPMSTAHNEPGSSLLAWLQSSDKATVTALDLADYILNHVAAAKPKVTLMKIDIEGHEHLLMPHLIVTGALCRIHEVFHEPHPWGAIKDKNHTKINDDGFIRWFHYYVSKYEYPEACLTRGRVYIDDESYDTSDFPLPQ